MIDLLLPAAPKDYVKVPYVIQTVAKFVPDIERVCLVSPDVLSYTELHGLKIDCYTDVEVLPLWYKREMVSWRPNWITQQIIKLTQTITQTEYWLTTDADKFFNDKISLFREGKPILYTGAAGPHLPYIGFNRMMLGEYTPYPKSFLSECTLYKREFIDEMLNVCGGGRDGFIHKLITTINTAQGHPADSELYGSFIMKYHPDHYIVNPLINSLGGRYGTGEYTEREIIAEMERMKDIKCQTYSMHSWSYTWN